MQGKWINRPQEDTTVIFIHGILSDGEKCWQNDNGVYWPELLKQQNIINKTGIYVFTYNTGIFSGNYSIGDVVDSLWEFANLDKIFQNIKKFVFICHSMGGIVARRFIVKHQQYLSEKNMTIGLFLIASPSLGADYGKWITLLAKFMGHTQAKALKFSEQNTWLNDLDRDFQNLIPSLTIIGKELIEDKPLSPQKMGFLKIFMKKIVKPFSGARYFGHPIKISFSDHVSIAKPKNNEAIQHRLLCKFIEDMPEPLK